MSRVVGTNRRRAQAAVEFALILPVFLLIVAGTMEFGRAFFAYGQLLLASGEGARYGAVLHKTSADVTTRVQQVAPGGASDVVTVVYTVSPTDSRSVAPSDATRGNVVRVTVQHAHQVLIPLFPLSSIPLTSSTSLVIE
jgi:Flp pilus assembly protein TadG